MKYVSDIKVNGKPLGFAKWPWAQYTVTITTHDIDTGATEEVSDFPIDDCYGFARLYEGTCFMARHTDRDAQLYKYIRSTKAYQGPPMLNCDTDSCSIYERADTSQFNMTDAPSRVLQVYSKGILVGMLGPYSSVVLVANKEDSLFRIFSLYNFLISVCRSTGLNIMAYGAVCFFDDEVCRSTEIAFSHGDEADRFFLKMYMMEAFGGSS